MSGSPTPWQVDPADAFVIVDAESKPVAYILTAKVGRDNAQENKRRIVACANAFTGVPTEAIEKLPTDVEGFVAALISTKEGGPQA